MKDGCSAIVVLMMDNEVIEKRDDGVGFGKLSLGCATVVRRVLMSPLHGASFALFISARSMFLINFEVSLVKRLATLWICCHIIYL